jgi:transcription elongation factor Elf1
MDDTMITVDISSNLTCPICENEISYDIKKIAVGDIIECANCGEEFEVAKITETEISFLEIGEEK